MTPPALTPPHIEDRGEDGLHVQPTRIADSFRAWRIADGRTEALPLDVAGDDLASIVAGTASRCQHKDSFVVAQTTPAGKTTLHHYAVKQQSKAQWVRCPTTQTCMSVRPLYASKLFSVAVTAFAPVEPWRWSPGADVVGFDRSAASQLIQGAI